MTLDECIEIVDTFHLDRATARNVEEIVIPRLERLLASYEDALQKLDVGDEMFRDIRGEAARLRRRIIRGLARIASQTVAVADTTNGGASQVPMPRPAGAPPPFHQSARREVPSQAAASFSGGDR